MWTDQRLSPRDRSIATVAALTVLYRPEELPAHLRRAVTNGLTHAEISALITHVAFYGGFPAAISASMIAADDGRHATAAVDLSTMKERVATVEDSAIAGVDRPHAWPRVWPVNGINTIPGDTSDSSFAAAKPRQVSPPAVCSTIDGLWSH